MHRKSSREPLCGCGPIPYDVKASPMILEALKKAEQGRRNATAQGATEPREKARETIAGRETEQKKIPKVPADANERGGPRLLKPCRIAAATFAVLLLFAGLIVTNVWVWLRPAAVTTYVNELTHTAKPERVIYSGHIMSDPSKNRPGS
jgi:hypothetical protein